MVEWKKIGDVCTFSQGIQVPIPEQSALKLEGYSRFLRIVDYTQGNEPPRYVPINDKRYWISKNEIAVVRYGTPGFVCRGYEGILANNLFKVNIKKINELEYSYLAYVLKSNIFQSAIKQKSSGGALQAISFVLIRDILIPIPALSEQNRIVGILDTFTSSIENLKQQIAERRKQYEYYRDQLLDLEGKEGVEMRTIQDVCVKICSGGTPSTSHKEYYNGNIPWLRTQEIDWKDIFDTEIRITEEAIANSSAKLIPANCVIVAMYGATAAKVAINKIPLSTNQACCNLEIDESISNYRYVYHWLCKEYINLKSMGEGSQNNINGQKIKGYSIPIPSLLEQSRIVSILDTFEASISNLEAQLSQREKQYEYYRNKLLTFE